MIIYLAIISLVGVATVVGYLIGRTDGLSKGVELGYQQGKTIGYSEGYETGIKTGRSEGYTMGRHAQDTTRELARELGMAVRDNRTDITHLPTEEVPGMKVESAIFLSLPELGEGVGFVKEITRPIHFGLPSSSDKEIGENKDD